MYNLGASDAFLTSNLILSLATWSCAVIMRCFLIIVSIIYVYQYDKCVLTIEMPITEGESSGIIQIDFRLKWKTHP